MLCFMYCYCYSIYSLHTNCVSLPPLHLLHITWNVAFPLYCSVVYFATPIIIGYYIMEYTNGVARQNVPILPPPHVNDEATSGQRAVPGVKTN